MYSRSTYARPAAPIAGAWLTSAWVALADRRGAGLAPSVLAMLVASLVATLLFGAFGAAIYLSVNDEVMLAWFRSGAQAAGLEAGALLGAFVGGHLGVTLAIARAITPKRG